MYRIAIVLLILTFFYKETFQVKEVKEVKDVVKNYKDDPFQPEKFSPCCCPSTYSSSSGCLCESKRIISLIASRGGNRMLDPL